MPNIWHLVTGEYPPQCGGVGDYTSALGQALAAAGDRVDVWTSAAVQPGEQSGMTLHALPDAFGPSSRTVMERAWQADPGIVLLQYVPNALGSKGANLPFCRWFSRLGRRGDDARVMFHEPYFYFDWTRPWAPANALAVAQRTMARLLLRGASRVYFSTETWARYLRRADGAVTLPIPSSIPVAPAPDAVAAMRASATGGDSAAQLVGHFGTYGAHVGGELVRTLPALASRDPALRFALIGAGGDEFLGELRRTHPEVARRAWAPGRLDAPAVASALGACDLLVQPYPDGITTRRTTAMAGLRAGLPIVSTAGALTEPVWMATNSVALAPAGDVNAFVVRVEALLADAAARAELGQRARATYAAHFSMDHTVAILRGARAS